MPYRKKTLRAMLPETRKVAIVIGEMESLVRRLKNELWRIQNVEKVCKAYEAWARDLGEDKLREMRELAGESSEEQLDLSGLESEVEEGELNVPTDVGVDVHPD